MISSFVFLLMLACQNPEAESQREEVGVEAGSIEAIEQLLEKGGVSSTLRVWPKEPFLGDIIHLELQVKANEGWNVQMPPFGEALGRFQIIDFEPSEKEDPQNQQIQAAYRLDIKPDPTSFPKTWLRALGRKK